MEHAARPQDLGSQLEGGDGASAVAAVDGDHAQRREQASGLPAVEIFDLANEAERAADRHDQHDGIKE